MFENYNHQYQQNDLKKDGFQNKIIIFVFFAIIAIIAILVCCIFLLKQEAFDKSVDAKINSTINFLKSELNKNKKSEDEILNGLFNAINKKAQLNQNNQENVMFKPIDKKKLIGFDKLIGFKDEKDASDRFIKSFKADIDNSDLGETNPPIGMLLDGVAGTGKTTLARALAKEVDVLFFEVSSSTFSCKYKGEGVTKVEKLF
ncbi:ATP-binding protein [Candidatus Phytoplasma luffae]|uniref:ATP-binding protein n=1 Tax=Loofah witches'-broom phytoplasma TaxID=35773 RepID=A0A975FIT2_LOWBP|nr:ATP-binding protein [Candidatus Phytoplasma luffae]